MKNKKEGSEAQSEVIGVILLLSISITAIGVILLFGQPIITGASDDVQFDRMENEFSLLDASMSSSVLGASESQSVSLNVEGGQLQSNPDSSWMRVEWNPPMDDPEELANITMGNVRYVQDGKTLAYEGGGVWRSNEGDDFTTMISPPEFHYRGSTLTLPAYNVVDEIGVAGTGNTLSVESGDEPALLFPSDEDLDNPLEEGNVTVTVKSEYYKGWESYFRDRTTGAIQEVNDEEQTVVFSLEVPTELALNAGIRHAPGAPPDEQGNAGLPSAEPIEIDLPSAENIVQPELDKCFGNNPESNCVNLDGYGNKDNLDENSIYYYDGTYEIDDYHNAPDANVTILIDGNLKFEGDFDVGTEDADPVEIYVGGDDGHLDLQGGEINTDPDTGNSSKFITYATGEIQGDFEGSSPGTGSIEYTGVIFAPNTDMAGCGGDKRQIAGGADITGSIVGDSICLRGTVDFEHGEDFDLDLTPDVSVIRFLHITENEVRLSS